MRGIKLMSNGTQRLHETFAGEDSSAQISLVTRMIRESETHHRAMKKLLLLIAFGVVAGLTGLTTPPVDVASSDVFNSQVAAPMEQLATSNILNTTAETKLVTADVYYEESLWRVCDKPLALATTANDEGRFGISAGPLGPDNPQWLVESFRVVADQPSDAWRMPAPDNPGVIEGRAQTIPIPIDVGLKFWRLPVDHV